MSTEFDELLRDGMERFTRDVGVPRGMALKARRHQQKRRAKLRAVTAAGTATALAGAVAAAGVTGAFSSAGAQQIHGRQVQTTAYVVTRVERALAPAAQDNVLGYLRREYRPGSILVPAGPGLLRVSYRPGASSPWSVGYTLSWMYHGTVKVSAFTATGQRIFTDGSTMGQAGPASTVVMYRNGTWWTWTAAATPARAAQGPAPSSCGPDVLLQPGPGNGWPAFIRHQLSCGEYALDGRQRVDGIDAIKITGNKGLDTLWVSPATYLPVRAIFTFGPKPTQTDFSWLAPTPANLALLHVSVPAGFRQVPPPSS